MMIEAIIFYLLLIDALVANFFAFFGPGRGWYRAQFGLFARYFPMTKGWTLYYLILVLWAGSLLYRAGALF